MIEKLLPFPSQPHPLPRKMLRGLAIALLAMSTAACAVDIGGASMASVSPTRVSTAGASEYQVKLAEYERIHGAYKAEADAYWDSVSAKRRVRIAKRRARQSIDMTDYVLTQPPVYTGPPRPVDPNAPPTPPGERREIPVVADFLQAAKEQWRFVPDQPANEIDFKRAYARAALAAGLTREQVIGIYAFETGGRGTHDTQAGVSPTRPRAISHALGYNQLLSTNSVSILAEYGAQIIAALQHKARALAGAERQHMERKIDIVRRMVAFSRKIPHRWSEYERVAKNTRQGLGIHAVLLDVDIGPLVQVQKLATSVRFARVYGKTEPLTAAELELMNLTGDGNGIDMVLMPPSLRERVPTSNFFQPLGYARNPVASRTKVVAGLIGEIQAHMDRGAQSPGARELASAF